MTRELEARLVKQAKKVLVFDTIKFIESKKFEFEGRDKSLYLIFGLYNSELKQLQRLSYSVTTGSMEFNTHMTWI